MRVIPSTVHDFRSNAERKVFDLLAATDLGPHAFAVHSLNLANHEYKRWSELDFVVAWEEGAYALEVKGGRIACSGGIWTFTNRFDQTHRKSEGPFDQSKSGYEALREALSKHPDKPFLQNICWGWGVVFPDIDFDQASVSWSSELIADRFTIADRRDLGHYLRRLARWWRAQGRGHHALADGNDLAALCKAIRPDFDRVPSLAASIDQAFEAVVRLTDEQMDVLDSIDDNPRIICIGGAGTGKSFLAVEAARREAAVGHKTLLLCRSAVFASFLRSRVRSKTVTVVDFDSMQPLLNSCTQFACTIIDEAQDLLSTHCLSRIEPLIQSGLNGGRWRMFMDPNNQSGLHEPVENDVLESLRGMSTVHRLKRNCRNTQQIVMRTQLITGADIGIAKIEGQGPPIELVDVVDVNGAAIALEKVLTKWLDDGVRPGHITVLSSRQFGDSTASKMSAPMASQLVRVDPAAVSKWPLSTVTFATIRDFKGLENRCIAVVDLDGFESTASDLAQIYVAMTRAHAGLWLAVPCRWRPTLDRLIADHTKQMLGRGVTS